MRGTMSEGRRPVSTIRLQAMIVHSVQGCGKRSAIRHQTSTTFE